MWGCSSDSVWRGEARVRGVVGCGYQREGLTAVAVSVRARCARCEDSSRRRHGARGQGAVARKLWPVAQRLSLCAEGALEACQNHGVAAARARRERCASVRVFYVTSVARVHMARAPSPAPRAVRRDRGPCVGPCPVAPRARTQPHEAGTLAVQLHGPYANALGYP